MMTSLKSGKTGKKLQKWTPTRGVRALPEGCAWLSRSEQRRPTLGVALEAEKLERAWPLLRCADDGHQPVVTVTDPKARTDVELGSANPAAAQLNRHRNEA